jgi:uncharacterized protein
LQGDSVLAVWPWYVAGPLIGLFVPALLVVGNRLFGISSNLRHVCAAALPSRAEYFRYDWRRSGGWNLAFALGILLGGIVVGMTAAPEGTMALAPAARTSIGALGVTDFSELVPRELFNWSSLTTLPGIVMLVGGGLLIGFGTAYAGGCTSGHAISGLADLQLPSLVATLGFFAGGLLGTWFVLPLLLRH